MCRGVEAFKEQGQEEGLCAVRLTGDVGDKSFLEVMLRVFSCEYWRSIKEF